MKKETDEIWADYCLQGIKDKISEIEFMKEPASYSVSVKSIFSDPKEKAIKKIRKYAEKWNYNFIYYTYCRTFPGFPDGFPSLIKRCDLHARLYRKLLKPAKVLEDIE